MTNFNIPSELIALAKMFKEIGYDLYLAGPTLRNMLMNLPVDRYTVESIASLNQVVEMLRPIKNARVLQTGVGTLLINIKQDNRQVEIEYSAFDKELLFYIIPQMPQALAPEPHLIPRLHDFSINCIYYDILTKTLINPVKGLEDLNNRVLRIILSDPAVALQSQPVKIFQMVRLSCQLDLTIDEATYTAAKDCVAALKTLKRNDFMLEFNYILLADTLHPRVKTARQIVAKGLSMLKDLGVWEVTVPGFAYTHKEAEQADSAEANIPLRLAALLQDLETAKYVLSSKGLDYENAVKEEVFYILKAKDYIGKGEKEIILALAQIPLDAFISAGKLWSNDLLLTAQKIKKDSSIITVDQLAISGRDIMQLTGAKGKRIAKIREKLYQQVVFQPHNNNYQFLAQKAGELYKEFNK